MRIKRPDQKNAQSMIEAAESDMKYTLSIASTPESGATIIRNIYESFRLLGDALLVARGDGISRSCRMHPGAFKDSSSD